MNKQLTACHLRHSFSLFLGLLALITGAVGEARAQSIPNPSFEANTFSTFPGYASDNGGGITGWVLSDPGRIGLNPGGGSPFADNGATPDGVNVAFVQSTGGASTLSTTITGLTPGTSYQVTFRANRRTGVSAPNPTWSLNGEAFVAFTASPEVGGANPYYVNTGFFVATNTTAALSVRNQTADDSTVLVDNFLIEAGTAVTNTGDSGPGSLRQAISVAGNISFATNLSGSTIVLLSDIVLSNSVTIDGSNLPDGITVDGGPGSNRIFSVRSGTTISLVNLTLTGGNGAGVVGGNFSGGAIYNGGTLALTGCTVVSNSAVNYGGAIENYGTLTLTNCTLSSNYAAFGGAIDNEASGEITLTHCTLSGNSVRISGGAIDTRYGNSLSLNNTIVAGNSAGSSIPNIAGSFTGNNNLTSGDPLLAVLGNYGGPTMTMPLLSGSPAIDAASAIAGLSTDQRGYPRILGASADIGAVEIEPGPLVTTAGDSGLGSLRYAVTYVSTGSTITFAPNLSGSNIVLGSEIVLAKNVAIDATSLPAGITMDGGPGNNRIFSVNSGKTVSLANLNLTGGNGAGASYNGDGGAILNLGALTLTGCTLSGNSAVTYGGAIETFGPLSLTHCTLSGNSAPTSGAIDNYSSTVALTHCTLSGNSASSVGGAIANYLGTLTLANTIAAGNTAPSDADISGPFTGNNNLTSGDPLLAALGNYGGPTKTMPPLTGSPAIDAATVIGGLTTDQRGFPRNVGAFPDIGAVEGAFNSAIPLGNPTRLGNGSFQFAFSNLSGPSYIMLATTNLALPIGSWSNLGPAVETPPGSGQFQFTDSQAPNQQQRFYSLKIP